MAKPVCLRLPKWNKEIAKLNEKDGYGKCVDDGNIVRCSILTWINNNHNNSMIEYVMVEILECIPKTDK